MEPDDLLLTGAALTFGVALYAAIATRDQLRRDWPARKVRVRDEQRSHHGPFRAIENGTERDVSAGPPWSVHLTALLGHGVSPLSFFATCFIWFVLARTALAPAPMEDSPWQWVVTLLSLVVAFALGHYQWRGSTVTLTTRYDDARRHTTNALLGRLAVDIAPLALIVFHATSHERSTDVLLFAAVSAVPTLHALCAMAAVRVSRGHYHAAAVALRERETNTVGLLAVP